MRVTWTSVDERTLHLEFRPDAEDALVARRGPDVRLMTTSANIRLPVPADDLHPDLLALAAYAVVWPWTRSRLVVDRPVSDALAEAMALDGVAITPTGGEARRPGSRVSLAYSGGTDSIAASVLLPEDTVYVHLRRQKHPRTVDRMTHVKGGVLERLVSDAGRRGVETTVVRTDLEYVCLPFATFPVWWAVLVGSILTADAYDAGAVATGTVLEARYLGSGIRFIDHAHPSTFHRLFEAVGLPFLRPTAALTEVGTTLVARHSPLADLARSCLLGSYERPCLRCDKCLRKEMTTAAIDGRRLSPAVLDAMRSHPAMFAKVLAEPPLYMQDMVEYALARVDVSGTPLEAAAERLRPSAESTRWVEGYYAPALDHEVPPRWRTDVERRLGGLVRRMTAQEEAVVETWDAATRSEVPA
ncbi:DUF6395 domain-containing protein [Aquipuribacter nitratireducens]|uniref:DUF6395 domain-containing protein n=1 Tax=Aquipuribacter nitratireducens TaxID=650104 RepID=A0ABW0GJH5_9MICO